MHTTVNNYVFDNDLSWHLEADVHVYLLNIKCTLNTVL